MSDHSTATAPFTIIADTREQHPYTFDRIRRRAPHANEFVRVDVQRDTLSVGDYAAAGLNGIAKHIHC